MYKVIISELSEPLPKVISPIPTFLPSATFVFTICTKSNTFSFGVYVLFKSLAAPVVPSKFVLTINTKFARLSLVTGKPPAIFTCVFIESLIGSLEYAGIVLAPVPFA